MILSTILCTSPRRLVKKLLFGILFCYNSTTLLFVFALDVLGSFSPFGHFSMDLQRCHCNAVFFFFYICKKSARNEYTVYLHTQRIFFAELLQTPSKIAGRSRRCVFTSLDSGSIELKLSEAFKWITNKSAEE